MSTQHKERYWHWYLQGRGIFTAGGEVGALKLTREEEPVQSLHNREDVYTEFI